MYASMSYQAEARADLGDRDHRYQALAEARRIYYPTMEQFSDPEKFDQGIPGTLDMFYTDFESARRVMHEASQQPVPWLERVNRAGDLLPLDKGTLEDVDTLIVISGDHVRTGQRPSAGEIQALRQFLSREGTRLIIAPHHDIGASPDWETREIEYRHHGDPGVSGQERFGGFARELFAAFDIPVEHRYGLSSAKVKGTKEAAPLSIMADLDTPGLLRGVTTFNNHMHLPHLAITTDDPKRAVVLARQPINLDAPPHPFVDAGNREYNALVWLLPSGKRAGEVLVVDVTQFLTMFGGGASLQRFWQNVAKW
jgi:hypothetical protein